MTIFLSNRNRNINCQVSSVIVNYQNTAIVNGVLIMYKTTSFLCHYDSDTT